MFKENFVKMSNTFNLSEFKKHFYEYVTNQFISKESSGFEPHLLTIQKNTKSMQPKRNKYYDERNADILINVVCFNKYNIDVDKVFNAVQHENNDCWRFIIQWKLLHPFITVSLNRPLVASTILQSVILEKEHFGLLGNVMQKKILIFHSFPCEEPESAEALRYKVLFQNIQSLLKSNGYEVCSLPNPKYPNETIDEKTIETLLARAQEILNAKTETLNVAEQTFKENREDKDTLTDNIPHCLKKHHSDSDFTSILASLSNRNDEKIKSLFTNVAALVDYINNDTTKLPDVCIHLSPVSQTYISHKIGILSKLLIDTADHEIKNVHCNVGPVAIQDNSQSKVNFNRYVQEAIKNVFKQKVVKFKQDMETMMSSLCDSCLKFSLLSSNISQKLKIKIEDENQLVPSIKTASFIMYNYARLKSIINQFFFDVGNNKYPPLPPAAEVDFSLLKTEEEWNFLFNYVSEFPTLIENVVKSFLNSPVTRTSFQLHKMYLFLKSLSYDISNYYSKVHILSEPLPHLMPQLHCRIHLIIVILQIMDNSFHCLGIIPLEEM